jgi:hypothetical protein
MIYRSIVIGLICFFVLTEIDPSNSPAPSPKVLTLKGLQNQIQNQCKNLRLDNLLAPLYSHSRLCQNILANVANGKRNFRDGPFVPAGQCALQWFSSEEACRVLQGSGKLIVFFGDSLARHLQQGLYTVLSGNYRHGGIQHWLLEEAALRSNVCACDNSFVDRDENGVVTRCKETTMAAYSGPQSIICPTWTLDYLVPLIGWYTADMWNTAKLLDLINSNVAKYRGALLITSMGLHNDLDENKLFPMVHQPLVDISKKFQNISNLFMTLHAPQSNKPKVFEEKQGLLATRSWNSKLRDFSERNKAFLLDSFSITENATSYDGTHYGAGVNAMLAQILLNFIVEHDGVII